MERWHGWLSLIAWEGLKRAFAKAWYLRDANQCSTLKINKALNLNLNFKVNLNLKK